MHQEFRLEQPPDQPVTLSRREVIDLLAERGVEPRRSLGQNFVVDPNTVRRIVRLAGISPGDSVVEIGPGLGSLTLALVEAGATVTAIEADPLLAEILARVTEGMPVGIIVGDALDLDWVGDLDPGAHDLIANLPYNVATPLVAEILDHVPQIERMVVMTQKEVGQRLVAGPGSKAYGALSVKVASWARARLLGTVPPTVFHPRPRVESALVELVRHTRPAIPPDIDRDEFFTLVRRGFGQRRKMLRRSLRGVVPEEGFSRAGVGPQQRPEELDLGQWLSLYRESLPGAPR